MNTIPKSSLKSRELGLLVLVTCAMFAKNHSLGGGGDAKVGFLFLSKWKSLVNRI